MRHRSDGRTYWQAVVRRDGRRLTVWTGWGTAAEAEAELARLRGTVDDAVDLATARRLRSAPRIVDLLEVFLARVTTSDELAEATRKRYLQTAECLNREVGAHPLSAVDRRLLCDYIRVRVDRDGVSPRTARGELAVLRTAWGDIDELRHPGTSGPDTYRPFPRLGRLGSDAKNQEDVRPRPSGPDAWALLDAIPETEVEARRAVAVARVTGCRPDEALRLRVADIDLGDLVVNVRRGKTGYRKVLLSATQAAVLEPFVHGRDPAEPFVGPHAVATLRRRVGLALRDAARRLGLRQDVTLRQFRRVVSDEYYASGISPLVEAGQLGHSPRIAEKHYARAHEQWVRGAISDLPQPPLRASMLPEDEADAC